MVEVAGASWKKSPTTKSTKWRLPEKDPARLPPMQFGNGPDWVAEVRMSQSVPLERTPTAAH